MFIEDDSAWPGVQFNPAKGDLEAIGFLAKDVDAVGKELDELEHLLKTVGDSDSFWRGDAADRFAKKLGELPKYLKQGTESMQACAKALHSWQGQLQDFQTSAERIEAEAVTARRTAERCAARYDGLVAQYQGRIFPEDQVKQINRTLDEARDDASSANEKLGGLIREAERIHAQWKDRAGEAERSILKASENSPPDLSLWGRITDGLKEAWRDFKDWLVENADLLSTISAGLAAAAMALQFIPVVGNIAGGVLAVGAGVCAAGAMAGHWMGNARGNGTPGWKVALDAAGVLPFVGGVTKLTKLAKLGKLGKDATATGGALSRFAEGTATKLRDSLTQMHLITNPTQKILGKFGAEMGEKAVENFNAASQGIIKGASSAYGAIQRMGDDGETTVQAPKAPSGTAFHGALAA
ncbi:putative T7SS-secreted protein [Streptomyces sp. ISL-100]|uniref:putative T7SS-secreted protein n=1 Tax=Streptomyces sp. ISL-100 TaxID=2819173 RepID=UPI002035E5C4|nr:hypothetical protein [Streptomyces sp. ISL-100]